MNIRSVVHLLLLTKKICERCFFLTQKFKESQTELTMNWIQKQNRWQNSISKNLLIPIPILVVLATCKQHILQDMINPFLKYETWWLPGTSQYIYFSNTHYTPHLISPPASNWALWVKLLRAGLYRAGKNPPVIDLFYISAKAQHGLFILYVGVSYEIWL